MMAYDPKRFARAGVLAHVQQFAFEFAEVGNAVLGVPRKARACRVRAHTCGFVRGEEQLADRCQMQRRPPANGTYDLHAGTLGIGALDIDDLIALTHREIHRLAGQAVQFAHWRQRSIAHRQTRLDQIAQLQQGKVPGAPDSAPGPAS